MFENYEITKKKTCNLCNLKKGLPVKPPAFTSRRPVKWGVILDKRRKVHGLLKKSEPYLYLLPAGVCFALFLYYPFFKTVFLSLFITNRVGLAKIFVGLGNYIELFGSQEYRTVLLNTLILSAIVIVFSIFFGFVTASLASVRGKAFKPFTYVFSIPLAVASASTALVFEKMLSPGTGIVDRLLNRNIEWFTDPRFALLTVGILTVWLQLGVNFIFINAALRNVPQELYESASIDGAGGLSKMLHITLPNISPILFFVSIMNVISAFQSFAQVNVITQGGPGDSTNVMVFNIYRDAFFNFKFGYAAAQSVILFLIILVITLIQFKNEKRLVNYA